MGHAKALLSLEQAAQPSPLEIGHDQNQRAYGYCHHPPFPFDLPQVGSFVLSGLFHFVFQTIAQFCCGGVRMFLALAILLANGITNLAQDINALDNLAPAVRPETPPAELRQLLAQATATAAAEQWDETIDLLMQVQARAAGYVLALDNSRFVSIGEICQQQLAALPPVGLARYRQRYDEQAAQAFERAKAAHDLAALTRVTQQWLVTSSGDDALWLLGEWYLEQGCPGRARECWSRLHRSANSNDLAKNKTPPARLIFPDTTIPLVELRARLLLCMIAEQRWDVTERELKKFSEEFPAAPGQLGGRKALWDELLRDTLIQARTAATPADTSGRFVQTTYAGNARRNFQSSDGVRPRVLTWTAPWQLSTIWQTDLATWRRLGLPDQRITEDHRQLLSVIPVMTDRYVLACDDRRVYALDRITGEPAWPSPQRERGEIYFAAQLSNPRAAAAETDVVTNPKPTIHAVTGHGVPRFTMTVQGSLALARLGSPVTLPLQGQAKQHPSELVCLDLERQGSPLWTLRPPSEAWIFEGTPVCDVEHAYQLLRYVDARPQWHVACYELATGVQRWRTLVGSGEALGRGQIEEMSHTLLTLAEGRLFFCTNQGIIAALEAETGALAWLANYPRGKSLGSLHWQRDLAPPVYDAGTIYVAPSDARAILALDAGTGETRWSNPQAGEALHLLGTTAGHLIATGRTVRWLELETGHIAQQWPDNDDRNQGSATPLGRGVLAGGQILWPQRGGLARLHQHVVAPGKGESIIAAPPLLWSTINQELSGGNLLVQDEQLLVATGKQVWSLGPQPPNSDSSSNIVRAAQKEKPGTNK